MALIDHDIVLLYHDTQFGCFNNSLLTLTCAGYFTVFAVSKNNKNKFIFFNLHFKLKHMAL